MNDVKKLPLIIGFITYGQATAPYLPYFLSSLKQQTFQNFKVLALDNSEQEANDNSRLLKHDDMVSYQWSGSNLGFSQAYNILIRQAKALGSKYFLMLNPDMILDADAIERLVSALEANEQLAAVAPKILRWDFVNQRQTNIIDSCGIVRLPGLRFIDLGQGQVDQGQYDHKKILGPSGCAGLYRLSALTAIAEDNDQYFDEAFFMYKEDIDLVYRLQLKGYTSQLVPTAMMYHDRTTSSSGHQWWHILADRSSKSRQVKEQSFLGQLILFYKYWPLQNFWQKIAIWSRLKMTIIYALLFEPYLLKQIGKFWQIRKKLKQYHR